jgi:hypothetical protein
MSLALQARAQAVASLCQALGVVSWAWLTRPTSVWPVFFQFLKNNALFVYISSNKFLVYVFIRF